MARSKYTTEDGERRLALALSALAHILFILLLVRQPAPHTPPEAVIDVTLEPPAPTAQRPDQIVPPSARPSKEAPENTNRLSEVNARTEREQIRRGDGGGRQTSAQGAQDKSPPQPQTSREQPQPKQRPQKAAQRPQEQPEPDNSKNQRTPPSSTNNKRGDLLKNLTLDDATLASRFGGSEPAEPTRQKPAVSDLNRYRAFTRPAGSGASFLGTGGVTDHLPNLPDGDITLLNEKASTYAGFVRRVAVQVFAQLRSQGWEQLSYSDVRRMSGFTTVEAVLSPQGKLVRVSQISGSGSTQFDSVLVQAVNAGAKDPNPPEGAKASDGMIHFIFKARSWADVAAGARGAPTERRWLLLATGLE